MPLYKATVDGQVEMTAEEEAEFLAERSAIPGKKARLRMLINERKKLSDDASVTVGSVSYGVNQTARLELSNAYVYLIRNPTGTINIETKNGDIVTLDLIGLEAVFDAVNGYVSAVSNARKTHFANIKDLTKDNIDAYNIESLWP